MHNDKIAISQSLVYQLIEEQFPDWASLPIEPVHSIGTDNAIYRIGKYMAVRLPYRPAVAEQGEKEARWLPVIAPHLPLAVPIPLAIGKPSENYPYSWTICRWLEGENAIVEPITDWAKAATVLARFISALQKIDATDGPLPGSHNFSRGEPLVYRDRETRAAIERLRAMVDIVDIESATKAWEAALATSAWDQSPVWLHGDLHAGNLLVQRGRLSAVIDFGGLGIGDPACDLMVGWTLLTPQARDIFRAALSVDAATWARGRGWALSFGLIALPYYLHTNPTLAGIARYAIEQVLKDAKQ